MRNDWVRCGVRCAECREDQWYPFQGWNRCACGQRLWVERVKDDRGTRFPYRQGAELPADYPGWSDATK